MTGPTSRAFVVARPRPGGTRSAATRTWRRVRAERPGDEGFGLVEAIVALVVLSLVMLSTFAIVRGLIGGTAADRLSVEAASFASQEVQYYQQEAQDGTINPSVGTVTPLPTETIDNTVFTAHVSFTPVISEDASGDTLETLCTETDGSTAPLEIWDLDVEITWTSGGEGAARVYQHTQIAPGYAGAIDEELGEIAVQVDNGLTGDAILAEPDGPGPINFTATNGGTETNGDTDSSSGDTGSEGCGVLAGLDPNTAGDWTVTFSGNPGWVSPGELSDSNIDVVNGANVVNDPVDSDIGAADAGEVTVAPTMYLAQGQTETVSLQPVNFSGADVSGATVDDLPISVDNSGLTSGAYPCADSTNSLYYTFGNADTNTSSLLLYPFSDTYYIWPGDSTWADPACYADTAATSFSTTSQGTGSQTLDLPTLTTSVTNSSSDTTSGDQLEATEVNGGGYSYDLGPVTSTDTAALPDGQYELTTESGLAVTTPPYVWITPYGYYTSSTEMNSNPCPVSTSASCSGATTTTLDVTLS